MTLNIINLAEHLVQLEKLREQPIKAVLHIYLKYLNLYESLN